MIMTHDKTIEEIILDNSPLEKSLLVLSQDSPQNEEHDGVLSRKPDCANCEYGKRSMKLKLGADTWVLCTNHLCRAENRIDRGNGSFWVRIRDHPCFILYPII